MTVNEYRKKHKRCRTCKYLQEGFGIDSCKAKGYRFSGHMKDSMLRGCFCKLYEPREYEDG